MIGSQETNEALLDFRWGLNGNGTKPRDWVGGHYFAEHILTQPYPREPFISMLV